jgi:hypothetical protein
VDADPVKAAQSLVDRHVVKMILESCQLLSTAHRIVDGTEYTEKRYVEGSLPARYRNIKKWKLYDARDNILYQATHINHPSSIWCRESVENYNWLVEHMYGLLDEYKYRYEKIHKCIDVAYLLQSPPNNLKNYDQTKILCAMDDKYKISDDPIENYRNYYRLGKPHLHKWSKREQPIWI